MCHSDDSRPPGPPDPGEVAEHGRIELTSADGTRFNAYQADPVTRNGMSVVILPDVRGLHPFYEELAKRFAEAGFAAVAIDYFGRTAGTAPRGPDFEFRPHVEQLTAEHVLADTAAARASMDRTVFTVGFCLGGSHSWRLAASDLDLAGVIGFYGKPERVADQVGGLHKPMLLQVAGADAATPLAEFEAFEAQLTERGVPHEMNVYEGAPHSFFDRAFGEWREACDDSWRRMLAFTEAHRR